MLKPLGDKIIAKVTSADEVSRGGIILPDTAREKPQQAEVIAVGPGRLLDSGKVTPTTGMMPMTIPILIITCQKKMEPTPTARTEPKRSREFAAMRRHHRMRTP